MDGNCIVCGEKWRGGLECGSKKCTQDRADWEARKNAPIIKARNDALEEAAVECEKLRDVYANAAAKHKSNEDIFMSFHRKAMVAENCAAQIRARKSVPIP